MKYCSSCGAQNVDGGRFCSGCGASLEAAAPLGAPDTSARPTPGPDFDTVPVTPDHQPPPPKRRALPLAVAGVVLVAAAVGGGIVYQQTRVEHYPSDVGTTFLQSCQATGGNRSYCDCALNSLEKQYSFKEYKRLEARMTVAGEVPTEISDVIADCA